jgi:hypothetical protein
MNETTRLELEARIRRDNGEEEYPGLTVKLPLADVRALNNALICLRQLLKTDFLDPAGSPHTEDCLLRRRAGMPGCSTDCYAVREVVKATEHIKVP